VKWKPSEWVRLRLGVLCVSAVSPDAWDTNRRGRRGTQRKTRQKNKKL